MLLFLLCFAVAFATTLLATPLVKLIARRTGLVAAPSSDRWHAKPTALLGGTAIYVGFLIGVVALLVTKRSDLFDTGVVFDRVGMGIVLSSTLMFLVGLADDKLHLKPSSKIVFQIIAAATLISFGVVYPFTPWAIVNVLATVLWFIALTNAFNLLDNMDGVAAGVAGIAAAFLALTFAWEGAWLLSGVSLALAGAVGGFLPFNFHRASIFMGDSGSLFLGAVLAGMGAAYPSTATASIISTLFVPALIVIIPILDTLLVTFARTLAGRPISVGGRDHTSHRLVAMGLSERQVALLLYGFAAAGGVLAILLRGTSVPFGLSLGAIFLIIMLLLAAYIGKMHTYTGGVSLPAPRVTLLVSNLLHKRRAFELMIDLIIFAVAYQGAYLLRFDGRIPADQHGIFAETLAIAMAAKAVTFGLMGVYRGIWQHISMPDMHQLIKATVLGSLLTVAAITLLYPGASLSHSVFIIDAMLVALFTIGTRASFRSLDMMRSSFAQDGKPALLYGCGKAGEMMVRELLANQQFGLRPLGFLDDDDTKHGRRFHGLPVLGGNEHADEIIRRHSVERVIICSEGIEDVYLQRLYEVCRSAGVEVLQMHLELLPVGSAIPVLAGRAAKQARVRVSRPASARLASRGEGAPAPVVLPGE